MLPKNIPDDINVEEILSYFPLGKCKVAFKGLHKRNSYCDIIDIEEKRDETLLFGIGRNSLYNALPEYMFHPIDRFDNIPKIEEKERFAEEHEKQEKEKENAYKFFAPFDLLLLKFRVYVRERLREYTKNNKIILDIIGDRLTDEQKENRFIRQAIPFLPSCKSIRGDKTLMTLMLRKIFMEEGLKIEIHHDVESYSDIAPRYDDSLGSPLGDNFVGNVYDEITTSYDIHYWSDEECDERFLCFIDEIAEFQRFIQDYFMSVEEIVRFNVYKDAAPLRLSDDIVYNYLNYNTNI